MKRLQQLLTITGMSLILGSALAGCRKDETTTATSTSPAEPAQAVQAAPSDIQVPPGPVGIEVCDSFLAKSEQCVTTKAPPNEQDALKRIVEAVRHSYKLDLLNADAKAKLPERCKTDFEQTKITLKRFECDWDKLSGTTAGAAPADSAAAAPGSAAPAGSAEAPAAASAAAKKPAAK